MKGEGRGQVVEEYSWLFAGLMTCGVSLGALCFGYNLAVISGVMLYAQPYFQLDSTWQTLIVGVAVISATVSALVAGSLSDRLGRRVALLLTAALCVAGPVVAAAAPTKEVLLAGRLLIGFTFPLALAFCPMYIAEMSPASIRGRLISINQLQLSVGRLLSCPGPSVTSLPTNGVMQGFVAVPGLLFFIALFLLPETPRWLVAKGRHQEAERVLQRIYGYDDVSQKVKDIQDSTSSTPSANVCSTLSRMMKTPHVLKALGVGNSLAFFFVWSGINVILFFCGTILKSVGFPVDYAIWVQGLVPLALFVGIFPGILGVEKCGRRPLILISIAGCALSLMVASVGFHLTEANPPSLHAMNGTLNPSPSSLHTSVCSNYTKCDGCVQDKNCGLCYKDMFGHCLPARNQYYSSLGPCAMDDQKDDAFKFSFDFCPTPYAWIVVAGIFLYSFFFSPGMSALTFAVNAEIYPMWARGTCMSVVVTQFWLSNVVITFSFLYMVQTLKLYGTFLIFAGVTLVGFVILAIFLPETKNHSLEQVEELFMGSQELQRHRQQKGSNRSNTSEDEHKSKPLITEQSARI